MQSHSKHVDNTADNSLQTAFKTKTDSILYPYHCRYLRRLTLFEGCLVYSERKEVRFYFKRNAISLDILIQVLANLAYCTGFYVQ